MVREVDSKELATDDYWKAISYQGPDNYSKITVPALNITGWFDGNFPGSSMNYIGMKKYGRTAEARKPRLVIGPWHHLINTRELFGFDYGPDAVIDLNGVICRWFDHYLKGVETAPLQGKAGSIRDGSESLVRRARLAAARNQVTRPYLHSGGKANSLKGDGVLPRLAAGDETADSYVYDPADPTPDPYDKQGTRTMAVRKIGHIEGPVDARIAAIRDDVLVYQDAAAHDCH